MCAGAIAWAQIGTLVYGASDQKKGFTLIKHNILHPKTLVRSGIMEYECSEILINFFNSKRDK
jgi:tRNA(adenine34) deaminase